MDKAIREIEGKQSWKPGNMLYPVPAVLVTVADRQGRENIFTVAWAGTICSEPPMLSISVRPERYSHHMIEETGEFVINLTTRSLVFATDYCGVKSGRNTDKVKDLGLTLLPGEKVSAPILKESPVNLECRVKETLRLGAHDMYVAEIVAVHADQAYMDETGKFSLESADPIAYSHGAYYTLGEKLGTFGYSVKK